MRRRNFLTFIGLAATVTFLSGCGEPEFSATSTSALPAESVKPTYEWKMVTSWPKNFPGLGMGPERFAKLVDEMSAGRLTLKVYGGGELVPLWRCSTQSPMAQPTWVTAVLITGKEKSLPLSFSQRFLMG